MDEEETTFGSILIRELKILSQTWKEGIEGRRTESKNAFWTVDTSSGANICSFNYGRYWGDSILDIYKQSLASPDMCDFTIYHVDREGKKEAFSIPRIFIQAKSSTVNAQVTSGMLDSDKSITIGCEETENPNVVRTIVAYIFTGFLHDPSIKNPVEMSTGEAREVVLSFSVLELYKVARFLQMDSLLRDINEHLLDIYKPHLSNRRIVENYFAGLIYIAQVYIAYPLLLCVLPIFDAIEQENMDENLMEAALSLIESRTKSSNVLLLGLENFSKETWDKVIRKTRGAFMFSCQVFVVYKILFKISTDDINKLIKECKESAFPNGDNADVPPIGFTKILAGFDSRFVFDLSLFLTHMRLTHSVSNSKDINGIFLLEAWKYWRH